MAFTVDAAGSRAARVIKKMFTHLRQRMMKGRSADRKKHIAGALRLPHPPEVCSVVAEEYGRGELEMGILPENPTVPSARECASNSPTDPPCGAELQATLCGGACKSNPY